MTRKSIHSKDYTKAKELLARDKLPDVLTLLADIGIEVTLLKGRLVRDIAEYNAGRLTASEYSTSRNRLGKAILDLLDTLIEEIPKQFIEDNEVSQKKDDSDPIQKKNVLENNTISSDGDLTLHTGDNVINHHHYYNSQGEKEKKSKKRLLKKNTIHDESYIDRIMDPFISKLEKHLKMSSDYQYSFSNPEYKILSWYFLRDIASKLKSNEKHLDELDNDLLSYTKKSIYFLKNDVKILNSFKGVLLKSDLKDSSLFNRTQTLLSDFIDTIDKIECHDIDAEDGVFSLDDKRSRFTEELERVSGIASKYSLS